MVTRGEYGGSRVNRSSISRSVQLGLLAKDMAAAKGASYASDRAQRHLIERLGKLHGLPQKMGQILSLTELTEDTKSSWTALTEASPALEFDAVVGIVEHELGQSLDRVFATMDPNGISASLSQVHRARLRDGREVAVKVQYPGIADAVWQDLRAIGWLTAPLGSLKRGFNLAAYQEEVRRILVAELDLSQEAASLERFAELAAPLPGLVVPRTIPELNTEKLLTMTWIHGEPFRRVLTWSRDEKRAAGHILARVFLNGCFRWRVLHGDPHPGNLRFRSTPSGPELGLLDFGCVKDLPEPFVESLFWIVRGVIDGSLASNAAGLLPRYVAAGFDEDLLAPMEHHLLALSEVIFEPFRRNEPYRLADWRLAKRVEEILGPDRWNFRFAGPADLLVFIRAYQGLIQYLSALDVAVNWQELFLDATRDRQPAASTPENAAPASPILSEKLCVSVIRDGRKVVEVTFRAQAAAWLDELMPEDVLAALANRAIDIDAIKQDIQRSNFAPGELFSLKEAGRTVRVWLE